MTAALNRIKGLASNLEQLGQRMTLGVTAPLAAFGAAALKSAGDIEALKLGLNSITKSAAETERQFTALREVAKLPGLGLEEAARGAVNLQALGFSFERSKNILLQFGNAIAAVGGTKDDLNEVIRQLGQLAARGQVTADNLKPVMERVPQVATIIREKFGANALGNPAETFKKLGISAQEFVKILETELEARIPKVTGGLKNMFENLSQSAKESLADVGNAIAPAATRIVQNFAVPAIEKVGELARAFKTLPDSMQTAILGMAGVVGATGPLIYALGSTIRFTIETASALTKLYSVIAASSFVSAIQNASFALSGGGGLVQALTASEKAAIPLAAALKALPWVGVAAGITGFAYALGELIPKQSQMDEGLRKTTQNLVLFNKAGGETGYATRQVTEGSKTAYDGLLNYVRGLESTNKPAKDAADAAKLASEHFRAIPFLEKSQEGQILAAQVAIVKQRYDDLIRSIAKFREQGGQQSIFDVKAPELGVAKVSDAIAELEEKTKGFISIMAELQKSANAVPISMFKFADAMRQVEVAGAKGRQAFDTRDMQAMSKATETELKKSEKLAKDFGRQVSLVTNDVARNITDLIFKGGKFKDVMVDALESVAKALVRLAIEKTLTSIANKILDITGGLSGIGKALGGVFGAAASGGASAATKKAVAAIPALPDWISGGIGTAAKPAISAATNAGGQAAGAAAQAGISAVAGIVTGAISAVSGVIGNFQMAGMNKTLDLIEKATRYSEAHLLNLLEKTNAYLPELANIHARLITALTQGVPIYNAPGDGGLRIAAGIINITIAGSNDPAAVAREMVKQLRLAGA